MLIMESRIPPEHMLAIGERLLDGSHAIISKDTIRSVLRSLNLQVYIEKWLQIIERCTGIIPPCPGPVILERLDQQFIELEKPFLHTKPDSQRDDRDTRRHAVLLPASSTSDDDNQIGT